ncbi:uncharacterized protein [Aegilops tauschii subsp. strangulata]|uniref:uncharacterized protein n=1 Tax=Aegilops tauschii subsp. strangulata TaxID=200361 RepID=UPI00098B247C|nr:uncharacterized protein LOC109784672 [Aegilops tauschii subsp. strangulata]
MLPRPRSSSGFRDVRLRPSGDTRLGLKTFETAHEAARAYDVALWRLGRPQAQMNFFDVRTSEQAQEFAPSPPLITKEDRRVQRMRERRLLIAEADEHAMAVWRERFPRDVVAENEFWAQRRAEQARVGRTSGESLFREKALLEAQCKLEPASSWDEEDPRWVEAFTSSSYTTEEDE